VDVALRLGAFWTGEGLGVAWAGEINSTALTVDGAWTSTWALPIWERGRVANREPRPTFSRN
jgi:hypothetical protein